MYIEMNSYFNRKQDQSYFNPTFAAVWTVYKAVKKSSPWGLGVGRYKYLGGLDMNNFVGTE